MEDGLPQSSVLSIIQTHDGYLWMGTFRGGLVRFDGNRFTKFNQHNTPELRGDAIVRLFEDSKMNLWMGTETAGIEVMRNGKIEPFMLGDGSNPLLMSVCEDPTGAIWLYTADSRLIRFQKGKSDTLDLHFPLPKIEAGEPAAFGRAIVAEKSGALWVGESSGMFGFHSSGFQPPALVLDQTINAKTHLDFILASQNGGVWRLMDGRVQKLNGMRIAKDFGNYPWGNVPVSSACEDQRGNLIVGTLGDGIYWYEANGAYQHVSAAEGLSSAFVLSLCVDNGGNVWVGTDGEGVNRIKRKIFHSPESAHSWVAQSMSADDFGGVWMTLNALGGFRGATYLKGNDIHDFNVGFGSNPRTVLVDREQRVWVGTAGASAEGLFVFQGNGFAPVAGMTMPGLQIFSQFEDRAGKLWVGTQNGLVFRNGQNWKALTTREGLSGNVITAIAEDAEGNLWAGTENAGLNLLNGGKIIRYRSAATELPGDDITALCVDSDGALWIGTSGHGMARFFHGKWTQYSTDNGLASDQIAYIIEDHEGYLWLGSNAGLMRIKKSSLDDVAAGTARMVSCRTYVETDGLPTRECSFGSQPAACRTPDGRLWFPTVKGLVFVHPADLKPNLQPPLVKIESVLVEGRQQKTNRLNSDWQQTIIIPPGSEQLEVDYTALNFSAPQAVRFKYWLDGRETTKPEIVTERVARFPKLPPGKYRFHVTACNEDGIWNETGKVLELTVQPFFWQTRWFVLLVVIAVLISVIASVRYVSTQKLQREVQLLKQQEELEKERARIARDLHDQLGANLTQVALLSEMAEDDKHSPEDVASHAQQISQTARETTRSLDEIVWAVNPSNDTLEGLANYTCKYAQDYLAMAQLRFRFDVPADLPVLTIPPEVRHNVFLAFKEAVNNVVKHAQATEAHIRLRLSPGRFTLEVEDNGRGLGGMDAEAAKLRSGLRNMRKRMEDIQGEFSIHSGTHGGTVVRLTVPVT